MLAKVLIALAGVAAVLAAPAPAPAPVPKIQARASCSASSQTYVDNLTCPTLQGAAGLLNYAGDSTGVQTSAILNQLNSLLISDDPVSQIAQDVTSGLVFSTEEGVVETLKVIAATVPELNPDCACNMVACNNDLDDAISNCNLGAGNDNQNTACGDAFYACGAFYSKAQIVAAAPCCKNYQINVTSSSS